MEISESNKKIKQPRIVNHKIRCYVPSCEDRIQSDNKIFVTREISCIEEDIWKILCCWSSAIKVFMKSAVTYLRKISCTASAHTTHTDSGSTWKGYSWEYNRQSPSIKERLRKGACSVTYI